MTNEDKAEKIANHIVLTMKDAGTLEITDPRERAEVIMATFTQAMGKIAMIEPEFMAVLKRDINFQ